MAGVEVTETMEIIVDDIDPIDIKTDEAFAPHSNLIVQNNHAILDNRDAQDAHPIIAITGLREELDAIQSIDKTIYSNKKQHANYYKWHDANTQHENRNGLFVAIYPASHDIVICDGANDVLGVTVAEAGFVGGQQYTQIDDSIASGRGYDYGLVLHAGMVAVRCETTVVVGDYVVPNSRGEAKKADGHYGYAVTALNEIDGLRHAMIALTPSSRIARVIADSVQNLSGRMLTTESNVVAVTNVANSAYAIAREAQENTTLTTEYVKEQITDALNRINSTEETIGSVSNVVDDANTTATKAKSIAEGAVGEAQRIGHEVYETANAAISAVQDIGAGTQSWAKRILGHSVGPYSQAYGLTFDQTQKALAESIGIIYVPTVNHSETYDPCTQEFIRGYHYTWDGSSWSPSQSVSVAFSNVYIIGTAQAPYWVVTGHDVVENNITYAKDTLYLWMNGAWECVGYVSENTLGRAVSLIQQASNEVLWNVVDIQGNVAAIDAKVTDTEASIQNLTSWMGSDNEKRNLAVMKQSADQDGAKLALVVVKDAAAGEEEDIEVAGASIVLSDTDKGAHIQLDADSINFTADDYNVIAERIHLDGYVTVSDLDDKNGTTQIHGSHIMTGTIEAAQINAEDLHVQAANIDGQLTAEQLATDAIQSRNYIAESQGTFLNLETGAIDSANFSLISNNFQLISINDNEEPSVSFLRFLDEKKDVKTDIDVNGITTKQIIVDEMQCYRVAADECRIQNDLKITQDKVEYHDASIAFSTQGDEESSYTASISCDRNVLKIEIRDGVLKTSKTFKVRYKLYGNNIIHTMMMTVLEGQSGSLYTIATPGAIEGNNLWTISEAWFYDESDESDGRVTELEFKQLTKSTTDITITANNVDITGALVVDKETLTAKNTLTCEKDIAVDSKLTCAGEATFNSKLTCAGEATFNSKLTCAGEATFNRKLTCADIDCRNINGVSLGFYIHTSPMTADSTFAVSAADFQLTTISGVIAISSKDTTSGYPGVLVVNIISDQQAEIICDRDANDGFYAIAWGTK